MQHLGALKKLYDPATENPRSLTVRERQIIEVLSDGATNKEIGRQLNLAEGTDKVHLHRIYRKLGIANRTVLAILAHQNFYAA